MDDESLPEEVKVHFQNVHTLHARFGESKNFEVNPQKGILVMVKRMMVDEEVVEQRFPIILGKVKEVEPSVISEIMKNREEWKESGFSVFENPIDEVDGLDFTKPEESFFLVKEMVGGGNPEGEMESCESEILRVGMRK